MGIRSWSHTYDVLGMKQISHSATLVLHLISIYLADLRCYIKMEFIVLVGKFIQEKH